MKEYNIPFKITGTVFGLLIATLLVLAVTQKWPSPIEIGNPELTYGGTLVILGACYQLIGKIFHWGFGAVIAIILILTGISYCVLGMQKLGKEKQSTASLVYETK